MIKAVYFDLYDTLACYDPPREQAHADACRTYGVDVNPEAIREYLPTADLFWRDENARSPLGKRTEQEQAVVYAEYEVRLLKGIGVEISHELGLKIMAALWKAGLKFKLFDDALDVLRSIKDRGLTTGLISNVGQEIESICKELGLQPYLDFKITSFQTGCDKPRPEIFQAALDSAQIKPEESMYIGDQYDQDIVGARGVGMKAILIDRDDLFSHITDCPRIRSLTEVIDYI